MGKCRFGLDEEIWIGAMLQFPLYFIVGWWVLPLMAACGLMWRLGGWEHGNKLWRRIGSSLCMIAVLLSPSNPLNWFYIVPIGMIFYGSWSYFGWLTPGDHKERWFNYLAAACITQFAYVVLFPSWHAVALALLFALAGALDKVGIDETSLPGKDIMSELFYGFVMCLGLSINIIF